MYYYWWDGGGRVQNTKEECKRRTGLTLKEVEVIKKMLLDILGVKNKMDWVQLIVWMTTCNHFKIILKSSPKRHKECIKKTKNMKYI